MAGIQSVWAKNADAPFPGLLGGRREPGTPEESEPNDRDFVCGHYAVTAEGKLLRKVKCLQKRAPKELSPAVNTSDAGAAPEPIPRGVPESRAAGSAVYAFDPSKANRANSLIVMPPAALWDPIQALRCKHDPAFERWMPHINMVWPFAAADLHPACAEALAAQLRDFPPFELHFNGFDMFTRGNKAATVFLNPTGPDGAKPARLHSLRERMLEAFPTLAGSSAEEFHPHMTVGKVSPAEAKGIVERGWAPMSFVVREVHLISRPDQTTPFAVTQTVPLGGGA